MKTRLDILIDSKIEGRFRKKFVKKKGDISKKIEELMTESLKTEVRKG